MSFLNGVTTQHSYAQLGEEVKLTSVLRINNNQSIAEGKTMVSIGRLIGPDLISCDWYGMGQVTMPRTLMI